MNFERGRTTAHLSIVPQNDARAVCVFASAATYLVIDDQAWFMTSPQPLQIAASTALTTGCGGYIVTTSTAVYEDRVRLRPTQVTLPFALDVVGGTAPYDLTVATPDGWSTTILSPSDEVQPLNIEAKVLTDQAGTHEPFDVVFTVTDSFGETVQLTAHYETFVLPPIPCT